MKNTKKIALAAMSLVAAGVAAAGATGTFAWFAVNSKVNISGMTATTQVSNNLFVAETTLAATTHPADNLYSTALNQAVNGLLEPVSTVDGKAFFYKDTAQVDATGAATNDTFVAYAAGDDFDGNYGLNDENDSPDALGYIDYVFDLKAVNASASAANLNLTKLDLVYNATATPEKAFRVGVFYQKFDGSAYTMVSEATLGTVAGILREDEATNRNSDKGVAAAARTSAEFDNLAAVTNIDAAVSPSVTARSTEYFKFVVRMWLEGQDTTCNNTTFADLNGTWSLNLEFKLGDGTAAGNISKYRSMLSTDEKTYYVSADKKVWDDKKVLGESGKALAFANIPADVKTAFGITE